VTLRAPPTPVDQMAPRGASVRQSASLAGCQSASLAGCQPDAQRATSRLPGCRVA